MLTLAGAPWLAIAYNLAVILVAWITARLSPNVSAVRLEREFDPVLSVRVPNKITLHLWNDGAVPIRAKFRDEPPPLFLASRKEFPVLLRSGSETALTYSLTPYERGSEFFRGSFVRVACPLGLVEQQVRLSTEQPVRVYPNVLALREFDFLRQKGKLNQLGIRKSISRFRHLPIDLVANSEIQCEVARRSPVVLSVEVGPQGSGIGLTSTDANLGARRITKQKIREGVAVGQPRRRRRIPWREIETSAGIGRAQRIKAQSVNIRTELEAVRSGRP